MMAAAAQGSIYVFSSDINWYDQGMTATAGGNLATDTSVTNALQATDARGWGYPTITAGSWAGANWVAPAGEVVTRVVVSGYHMLSDVNNPERGYAVYGGTAAGQASDVNLFSGSANVQVSGSTWQYSGTTMNLLPADGITQLQFRALTMLQDTLVAHGYSGYFGTMNAITITTEAVPEPATCLFVLVSGLGYLTRRQFRN
jgi:hypothetical protein